MVIAELRAQIAQLNQTIIDLTEQLRNCQQALAARPQPQPDPAVMPQPQPDPAVRPQAQPNPVADAPAVNIPANIADPNLPVTVNDDGVWDRRGRPPPPGALPFQTPADYVPPDRRVLRQPTYRSTLKNILGQPLTLGPDGKWDGRGPPPAPDLRPSEPAPDGFIPAWRRANQPSNPVLLNILGQPLSLGPDGFWDKKGLPPMPGVAPGEAPPGYVPIYLRTGHPSASVVVEAKVPTGQDGDPKFIKRLLEFMQANPTHSQFPKQEAITQAEWNTYTPEQKVLRNLWVGEPGAQYARMFRPEESFGSYMRVMLFSGKMGGQPTDEESELARDMDSPWKLRLDPQEYLKRAGPVAFMRIIESIYGMHRNITEEIKQILVYNSSSLEINNKSGDKSNTGFIVLCALMGGTPASPLGAVKFKFRSFEVAEMMRSMNVFSGLSAQAGGYINTWAKTALLILDGREGVKIYTAAELRPVREAPQREARAPAEKKVLKDIDDVSKINDIQKVTLPVWADIGVTQTIWDGVLQMDKPTYYTWLEQTEFDKAPLGKGGKFMAALTAQREVDLQNKQRDARRDEIMALGNIQMGSGKVTRVKGHNNRAKRIKYQMTHTMSRNAPRLRI
jgi:hypothetical protein